MFLWSTTDPWFPLWLEVSACCVSKDSHCSQLGAEVWSAGDWTQDFLNVKHNVLAYAFKVVCSCKALAESSYFLNLLSSSGFQIPFPVIPKFDLIACFGPCWYRLERWATSENHVFSQDTFCAGVAQAVMLGIGACSAALVLQSRGLKILNFCHHVVSGITSLASGSPVAWLLTQHFTLPPFFPGSFHLP